MAAKRKDKSSPERVPLEEPSEKAPFDVIAERRFQLRGPAKREVVVRIGTPEKDERDFRCAFQVVGLSDNSVQYSHGVDSFQAFILRLSALDAKLKTMSRCCLASLRK